jgi:hypothetical protein
MKKKSRPVFKAAVHWPLAKTFLRPTRQPMTDAAQDMEIVACFKVFLGRDSAFGNFPDG